MAAKTSNRILSVERAGKDQIFSDAKMIFEAPHIKELLNSLPNVIIILNENRQMVFGNKAYFTDIDAGSYSDKLGFRPGELLGCIHSIEDPDGCGASRNCEYCGALQVILKCQETSKRTKGEARITGNLADGFMAYDFLITASPLKIEDKNFTIVSLDDISDNKRIQALERIFFHDLLNKAGSLSCFFENIQFPSVSRKTRDLIETATNLSSEIVEEINSHRSVMEAEKGDLEVAPAEISAKEVLENIVNQMKYHTVAYEKHVKIFPDIKDITLITDYFLLIRVLINMLKNALEATSRNGVVTIGYKKVKNSVCFSVHNERVMDEEVKYQVFQRSFSTKGSNRGIGTYSMKLLGERYLGGKIYFESDESNGTTFFFELPIGKKELD
jgi:Histidine kinase-, DNA gyrase B-, and HSP90-like ATPase